MFYLMKADSPLDREDAARSYTHQQTYSGPTLQQAAERAAQDLAQDHHLRRLTVGYNHTDSDQATCVIFPELNLVLLDEKHTRMA